MPLNSINTNYSAMIALQSLNAINREMATVQTRISTGLKVSSVKDNPAIWAIAQGQRAELAGLSAVAGSLQRGQSVADVAIAAGETISDLLIQMKELALAAHDHEGNPDPSVALSNDYIALANQIDKIAANASFNGINLISGGGTDQVKALANTKGTSTIDIDHVDLSTGGTALTGVRPNGSGEIFIADIDAAIKNVNAAVARLGTGSRALDTHLTFIGKLQDTMETSIGRLVDADLAKESARFQALQVRQQLAIQALSIANQGPSLLLQLFR